MTDGISNSNSKLHAPQDGLLLAIDTCGPSGSVALGRLVGASPHPGRNGSGRAELFFNASDVGSELLRMAGTQLPQLGPLSL